MASVITQRLATSADLSRIKEFVKGKGLPDQSIERFVQNFVIAERENGKILVGVAGLEPYGESGLLRSVAVDEQFRGAGLGRKLVESIVRNAKERGVKNLYLLTETARGYFERLGFQIIRRDEIDERVRASVEFTEICRTATPMRMTIDQST
jgi:amino-acid N-acetyltransferase